MSGKKPESEENYLKDIYEVCLSEGALPIEAAVITLAIEDAVLDYVDERVQEEQAEQSEIARRLEALRADPNNLKWPFKPSA